MARPLDVALGEDAVVAECRLRLAARGGERLVELVGRADDAHAAPAAAGGRLDHEREADLRRIAFGTTGTPAPGDVLRRELVAAGAERAAVGPTKTRPAASTASAKPALSARNP